MGRGVARPDDPWRRGTLPSARGFPPGPGSRGHAECPGDHRRFRADALHPSRPAPGRGTIAAGSTLVIAGHALAAMPFLTPEDRLRNAIVRVTVNGVPVETL